MHRNDDVPSTIIPPSSLKDTLALLCILLTLPHWTNCVVLILYALSGSSRAIGGKLIAHLLQRRDQPSIVDEYNLRFMAFFQSFLRFDSINDGITKNNNIMNIDDKNNIRVNGSENSNINNITSSTVIATSFNNHNHNSSNVDKSNDFILPCLLAFIVDGVIALSVRFLLPNSNKLTSILAKSVIASSLVGSNKKSFSNALSSSLFIYSLDYILRYLSISFLSNSGSSLSVESFAYCKSASLQSQSSSSFLATSSMCFESIENTNGSVSNYPPSTKLLYYFNHITNFISSTLSVHAILLGISPISKNIFFFRKYNKTLDHLSNISPEIPLKMFRRKYTSALYQNALGNSLSGNFSTSNIAYPGSIISNNSIIMSSHNDVNSKKKILSSKIDGYIDTDTDTDTDTDPNTDVDTAIENNSKSNSNRNSNVSTKSRNTNSNAASNTNSSTITYNGLESKNISIYTQADTITESRSLNNISNFDKNTNSSLKSNNATYINLNDSSSISNNHSFSNHNSNYNNKNSTFSHKLSSERTSSIPSINVSKSISESPTPSCQVTFDTISEDCKSETPAAFPYLVHSYEIASASSIMAFNFENFCTSPFSGTSIHRKINTRLASVRKSQPIWSLIAAARAMFMNPDVYSGDVVSSSVKSQSNSIAEFTETSNNSWEPNPMRCFVSYIGETAVGLQFVNYQFEDLLIKVNDITWYQVIHGVGRNNDTYLIVHGLTPLSQYTIEVCDTPSNENRDKVQESIKLFTAWEEIMIPI